MSPFISILGAILAFFIVVLVHELGHFVIARAAHIKVFRFSIGFGKPIWSHVAKSGVEYVIGFLPLGGYVKMQDAFSPLESQGKNVGSLGVAFEQKSLWIRALVVVAGPFANIILAIIVFTAMYTIGVTQLKPIISSVKSHSIAAIAHLQAGDSIIQTGRWTTHDWQSVAMEFILHKGDHDPLALMVLPKNKHQPVTKYINLQHWNLDGTAPDFFMSLGFQPAFPKVAPRISVVEVNSPAEKAGLRINDLIMSINQKPVDSWQALVPLIAAHKNQTVKMTIKRDGFIKNFSVLIGEKNHRGFLGVSPKAIQIPANLQYQIHYAIWQAIVPAVVETWRWTRFQFSVLVKMLSGTISPKTIGGPISIFETAGKASTAGLTTYLNFIAFISVAIGVLNILPVPALDGGHLLFCAIESIIRRPIPIKIQVFLINVGVVLLITLIVFATTNDLFRLIH